MGSVEVILLSWIDGLMVILFFFSAPLVLVVAGPEETKYPAGKKVLRLIRIRLATPSLTKIRSVSQDNSAQVRTADSSSGNAVNFSSAHTLLRSHYAIKLAAKS